MPRASALAGVTLALVACTDAELGVDAGDVQLDAAAPGRSDAQTPDANPDESDAGTTSTEFQCVQEPRDDAACWQSECDAGRVALDIDGSTPSGPIHIDAVRVSYERGFANSTQIELEGNLNDVPITLSFAATDWLSESLYLVSPGEYNLCTDNCGDRSLRVSFGCCNGAYPENAPELYAATLVVQRHEPLEQETESGVFKAELTLSGDGWDLHVPISTRTLCDSYNSI